eukprot:1203918-Rhodomonas_salina.1
MPLRIPGAGLGYDAMSCPVLSYAMLLPGSGPCYRSTHPQLRCAIKRKELGALANKLHQTGGFFCLILDRARSLNPSSHGTSLPSDAVSGMTYTMSGTDLCDACTRLRREQRVELRAA